MPLAFEVNHGQTDSSVRFLARMPDGILYLRNSDPILALPSKQVVRLHFVGASFRSPLRASALLPGRVNYFLGKDPHRWLHDLPTYGRVEQPAVYAGIDLAFHGRAGVLEYDWLVHPGADPGHIALQIEHAGHSLTQTEVGGGGLSVRLGTVLLLQGKPIAYQWHDGHRQKVQMRYELGRPGLIRLVPGPYDRHRPLVIDPTLVYSTYLGGSDSDGASGIAVDPTGAAYLTGDTMSLNFPTDHPQRGTLQSAPACLSDTGASGAVCTDAFVTKLSADGGSLRYSTYIGGSLDDAGHAIAVDSTGSAYITGNTTSADFPVIHATQGRFGGGSVLGDAFLVHLHPSGDSLLSSSYLGGSGEDDGEGIALVNGKATITGSTDSANFPVIHAFQPHHGGGTCQYAFDRRGRVPCYDAFVTQWNTGGASLLYSTYLGGAATDMGWGIAAHDGYAYVAGETNSANFPTRKAIQARPGGGQCPSVAGTEECSDAFLAIVNGRGEPLTSTYLGGRGADIANAVAVDSSGRVYLTGKTESPSFPLKGALQSKFIGGPDMAFVTRFAPFGVALSYSTYLGGSGSDEAYGIVVDRSGDAFVTGRTSSPDFPTATPIQAHLSGTEAPQNAFVSELSPSGGSLLTSTFLGGNDHDLGASIALDPERNVTIDGFASSLNFPIVHPLQGRLAGGTFDAFVLKIHIGGPASPKMQGRRPHGRLSPAQ